MLTISDIYKDDLPDDSIFVLEYPSSHRDNIGNPLFLVNSSRYLVDDEFRVHDYESNRLEKPHRNLPMLGTRVRAYVAEPPPTALISHWQRRLGIAQPRYADLGDPAIHVCLFPLQDLRPELHAFDPDEHYHVYSKVFISEIDCPKAAVLDQLKLPAVLKVSRSSGGYGTWKIDKEEDYEYWMTQISKTMPYAETILTEMVENIKHNMCCHMYLSRKGELTWIAVTEKILDDDGIWIGAVMRMSRQEEYERMVRRTAEPVSAALHARGFFGLFGVDVLVDSGGRQFVVDINPRILGSTPLVFTQRGLEKIGRFREVGIFLMRVTVKADSAEAVVDCAEAVEGGEVIVYSLIDEGGGMFRCQIAVFASSIAECRAIAEDFCLEVMSDNALGGFHCR